jgi:hypothetical protein
VSISADFIEGSNISIGHLGIVAGDSERCEGPHCCRSGSAALRERPLLECGAGIGVRQHSLEVVCLPFGTDAGAAGEDVRKTAGGRQEKSRGVVAKTRSTGVRLRTGRPARCPEVAAEAPAVLLHLDGEVIPILSQS